MSSLQQQQQQTADAFDWIAGRQSVEGERPSDAENNSDLITVSQSPT